MYNTKSRKNIEQTCFQFTLENNNFV